MPLRRSYGLLSTTKIEDIIRHLLKDVVFLMPKGMVEAINTSTFPLTEI